MNLEEIAIQNTIFKSIVGSHMYGLSTPDSDRDEVGIFIPPKDFILGIHKVEQVEIRTNSTSSGNRNNKDDIDLVLYDIRKFLNLLKDGNPNIVELLFAPENCLLKNTKYWREIQENKDAFLSLKIKHTFLGYAFSQKKKIITKKKTYEQYRELVNGGLTKDEAMKSLREPIGNRLEYYEKYGFDVKYASHLIRLLYEGIELLREGELHLPLYQNKQILDIKQGKISLEEVLKISDELEGYVNEAYIKSPLPHKPNLEKINSLQIKLIEDYWHNKGDF